MKEDDLRMKFKYILSTVFLILVFSYMTISFSELYKNLPETTTSDSLMSKAVDTAKFLKHGASQYAKTKNPYYYDGIRMKKILDKYMLGFNLTTSLSGTVNNPNTRDDLVVSHKNGELDYLYDDVDISEQLQTFVDFGLEMQQDERNFVLFEPPYKYSEISEIYRGIYNGYDAEKNKEVTDTVRSYGLDVISMAEIIQSENIDRDSIFFKTDHHWLPQTGLWACKYLGQYLNENCGYTVDNSIFDIDNYDIQDDTMWLGSQGRKVTEIYCDTEPMPLIIPNYTTDLEVYYQHLDKTLKGTISETLFDWSHLEGDNLLTMDQYWFYGYGSKPLIQIHNNLKKDGKRMLIVKESFANCMYPYLSNAAEYVDVIDVRHYTESLHEYIAETNPDTVVVIYSANGFTPGSMKSDHFF